MYQAHAQQLLNQKESENDSYVQSPLAQPLYAATERLVAALERLENNLQYVSVERDRGVHQEQQLLAFERENESLRQERENLNAAVTQLKHRYNDLHLVASAIYGKLDDSIKKLTQIIEN